MDTGESHNDLLPLLLRICDDFFIDTSPTTRHELDALLRARNITGGSGWLIDLLAITRRRLQNLPNTAGQAHGRITDSRIGVALELSNIDHVGQPEPALKLGYKRLPLSPT